MPDSVLCYCTAFGAGHYHEPDEPRCDCKLYSWLTESHYVSAHKPYTLEQLLAEAARRGLHVELQIAPTAGVKAIVETVRGETVKYWARQRVFDVKMTGYECAVKALKEALEMVK